MYPEVLIIGCGFLGEAAADLFCCEGKSVLGLVRRPDSACMISSRFQRKRSDGSFQCGVVDVTDLGSVEALTNQVRGVPLAIFSVSSGRGGADAYAALYRDGLIRVLEQWRPEKMVFVSSTSVYGQSDSSWVTEASLTAPDQETSKILVDAEVIALDAGATVARLSGIYGPGRSVLLRKFISGEALLENGGERWINQVHRDDAAAALVVLGRSDISGGVYNITDDTPATQKEVYGWMAEYLKRPLPPEGPADLKRKRGWTSKRVSNALIRSQGWRPRFASYRDALPQLLDGAL